VDVLHLDGVGRLHHLKFLNPLVEDLELFFALNQEVRFDGKLSLDGDQLLAKLGFDALCLHNQLVLVLSLVDSLLLFKSLDHGFKSRELGGAPLLLVVEKVLDLAVFSVQGLVEVVLGLESLCEVLLEQSKFSP